MIIYDNCKVCVLAVARCGHTSMTGYFGFEPHTISWGDPTKIWLETKSRRVLVLRNPIHRAMSAKIFTDSTPVPYGHTSEDWFRLHMEPYLKYIPKTLPFDIIPFEKLSDYIPRHVRTIATRTNYAHHRQVEMTPEMREELALYRYFMQYCNVITPEEWKELTP